MPFASSFRNANGVCLCATISRPSSIGGPWPCMHEYQETPWSINGIGVWLKVPVGWNELNASAPFDHMILLRRRTMQTLTS